MELYKKCRPKTLDKVVGQPSAVTVLKSMVGKNEIPHALLLSGPSGCGKTTIARILRKHVKCKPEDFHELNIADIRGIDNVRDIRTAMRKYAIGGGSKVFLLDEVAELTSSAQKALLKMLEDTPDHVYFMLCTTDPQKLIKPIRTRCTEIALKPIDSEDLKILIGDTSEAEGKKVSEDVADKIIESSEGSARKALVLLDSVIRLESEEEMLEVIEKSTQEKQGIDLCRALLNAPWKKVAEIVEGIAPDDVETVRWIVLGYMKTIVLGGGKIADKAYRIMCCFERNFFDTKHNGLVMACWEAVNGK